MPFSPKLSIRLVIQIHVYFFVNTYILNTENDLGSNRRFADYTKKLSAPGIEPETSSRVIASLSLRHRGNQFMYISASFMYYFKIEYVY